MSLSFGAAVDAVAAGPLPLLAVGTSDFSSRYWNGALHILTTDHVRGSAAAGIASDARRGGVTALAWMPSQSPTGAAERWAMLWSAAACLNCPAWHRAAAAAGAGAGAGCGGG